MRVFVIDLEPLAQRYTTEISRFLPLQIEKYANEVGVRVSVERISGNQTGGDTTSGAFFNFAENIGYQSQQTAKVASLFESGRVKKDDGFLFLDAWHPGVLAARKLADLVGPRVRIMGLWHAGSYDPNDFLGRIKDRRWLSSFEVAVAEALDASFFATKYHLQLFQTKLIAAPNSDLCRVGFPFEYLPYALSDYDATPKENLIVFPHRLAPEKQPEIFRDLASSFPDYKFVCCQDQKLTKHEYHSLLGKARMVFSANLQETLGIGVYEGLLCGAVPFVPDRLSYNEMYPNEWRYPSHWTSSWAQYQKNKLRLVARMRRLLDHRMTRAQMVTVAAGVGRNYFNGQSLYATILGDQT